MTVSPVSKEKGDQLRQRMLELGIREEDFDEKFIRGGGKGGQKINKTSSCVYLIHRPSGIEVKCQRERSQALNRYLVRRELCDRIEEMRAERKSARQQAAEKIRRQKRRRSRRQKQRMVADKRHQGEKKRMRSGPVRGDD
ncbi:MAG: peptide chain release factor-like protein [Kiritimatiellia bacterium]